MGEKSPHGRTTWLYKHLNDIRFAEHAGSEDAVRAGDGREIWHLSKGALVALDGRCLLRQGRNLRLGSCDEQPGQVGRVM